MSQYIGNRIVPRHDGVWDKTKIYESLIVVFDPTTGKSYISRKPVPAGTLLSQTDYWALCSEFSEQIALALKEVEQTENDLTDYVDATEKALQNRVKEAENTTNTNKSDLESRMATIESRLDANVKASGDGNANYGAEVVDARVHESGTEYANLGAHIRALDDGSGITSFDAQKLVFPDFSMKRFYDAAVAKNSEYFSVSYDKKTDTFRLACLKDLTGDYILYAQMWNAEEYAAAVKAGEKLYMKLKAKNVKNSSDAFRFGLWMGRTSNPYDRFSGSLINSTFAHSVTEGVFEETVSIAPWGVEFDEESGTYKKGDQFVNLQFALYANSPKAGEEVTICGYGGIFQGISKNGNVTMFDANRVRADLKETKDRITEDEEEISRIAPALENDALDCRVNDFAPDSVFAPDDSVCEKVKDEYGDQTYRIVFSANNPMYQMNLEEYMQEDDREVIVELQARNTVKGGALRVQLYDRNCGLTQMSTEEILHKLTIDYRRYQFRLDRRNIGNTTLGIGPERRTDVTVQFKDVKIYIPNAGSRQVQVPLKHFYGYPAEQDFSKAEEEKLEQPLIFGTDDYADADDLYLDTIDLYSTKQRGVTFHIGCIDQYGLLQTVSTFSAEVRNGANHLKFDGRKIHVPSGNGIFAEWDQEMAVYKNMPEWGYHNLVSTKWNYFHNAEGYSGYPLLESALFIPMRYSLIEKPLNVKLDEIQSAAEKAQEDVKKLKNGTDGTGSLRFIDPNGVKYSPTVSADGTLSLIRSIPKRTVVFGNSLTLGFGTFGMAASDSKHDYFYYLKQFITGKDSEAVVERYGGSPWEGMTDSASRKSWVDGIITSYIKGTEDLIIIQLSDNVNTDEKRATFAADAYTMLQQFRNACPKARIVWIAAWYGYTTNYAPIEAACKSLGCDLVDIRDLSGVAANQSAVGNTYTKDDGTVETITSSGVASHPGDTGMKLIADRVIELLESYM